MAATSVLSFVQYMLDGLRSTLRIALRLPFRIQFIVVWFFVVLWLLFDAPSAFGEDASKWQILYILYLVSMAFVAALSGARNPLIGVNVVEFVTIFVVTLIGGAAIFKGLKTFTAEPPALTTANVYVALTHIFVIAIGEELLFRGFLPLLLERGPQGLVPFQAETISAVGFGLLHWWAYHGNWHSIFTAIVLGLIFGGIVARFPRHGLIVTSALHAAWNLSNMGYI